MSEVTPFPFADVDELKARWPDFPPGAEQNAEVLLEDASQFMLDLIPSTADAAPFTRRRIVCAVVRRSMEASQAGGQQQLSAGPFGVTPAAPPNPHGDFYLTKNEKQALGYGKQKAFSVPITGPRFDADVHRPWCSLAFGATYCSCGADIAGEPIYER